jgi:hypothetical protein
MTHDFSPEQCISSCRNPAFKSPKRITITIPHSAFEHLLKQSDYEGRSLSNLAAFILEIGIEKKQRTDEIRIDT